MQCANPSCCRDAHDLQQGTLRILEMEVPPEERTVRAESGFPVVAVPVRYFWLCAECSQILRLKRWTPAGLVFESRLRAPEFAKALEPAKNPPGEVAVPHPEVSLHQVA